MEFSFKVRKPTNLQELFERAKSDAKEHNITWNGDIKHGHGSGFGFEGSYSVDIHFITITVFKKPLLISKTKVEREVKKYILL